MKDEGAKPPDLRQRTKQYALRIIRLYTSLPSHMVAQTLGKQLLRSGTSVGANYREGFRARSNAEMSAKLGLCVQELEESAYWMELLVDADQVPAPRMTELRDETDQLIAIFTAALKKLATQRNRT